MGRSRYIAKKGAAIALLLTSSACAPSGQYMGIDTSITARESAASTPEGAAKLRQRDLIMMIAMMEGCYERVPGGFKPVRAVDAPSFECAEKLAAVENLSAELGIGAGPNGLARLNITRLARQAQSGNRQAQFELGNRFEQGIGVERDMGKACKLYGKAATQTGGTIWVYQPPVGNGTSGRTVPINTGPVVPGLPAAQTRLEALRAAGAC